MLTHGLFAIEKFMRFIRFPKCDISFKSVMLLLANVKVSIEEGKYRSHCRSVIIRLLCKNSS